MVRYELPTRWILHNPVDLLLALVEAKAAIQSLQALPYQRSWVDKLQELQLKREVAGTSRIEGAEFDEKELEAAISPKATFAELLTRSQRQAHSAMQTYRWIETLPADQPISASLILEVHRRLVTDCDDDHCPPGMLRGRDHNVTFGIPPHRGVEGGQQCERAFASLLQSVQSDFRDLDPLLQALALHYHLAAMHPFLDGNGRTARAAEALALRKAGLTDRAFIAMSNYYYEEKANYLKVLSETRAANHDLTGFFQFGLRGIRLQCEALTGEIRKQMQRALFRDTMYSLFNRLETKRKRVIGKRQIEILKILLDDDRMLPLDIYLRAKPAYLSIKNGMGAFVRDLSQLEDLKAIRIQWGDPSKEFISINLDWPQEIDDGEFLRRMKAMPKGKSFKFLS
jgi:Fic family protein